MPTRSPAQLGIQSQLARSPNAQSSLGFPKMEKFASRFARLTSRPPRTRPRLCKHCAASVRRRGSLAGKSVQAAFRGRVTEVRPAILFPVINQTDPFCESLEGRVLGRLAWPCVRLPEKSVICIRQSDAIAFEGGEGLFGFAQKEQQRARKLVMRMCGDDSKPCCSFRLVAVAATKNRG